MEQCLYKRVDVSCTYLRRQLLAHNILDNLL